MDQPQLMGSMVAGIVASAVVQEGVSRGFSYVLGKRKEMASMGVGDALEKLEQAHSQLEFVLERSTKLPITDVSLLRRQMMIKSVYHQCDVLLRSKRQALNDHHSSPFPLILGHFGGGDRYRLAARGRSERRRFGLDYAAPVQLCDEVAKEADIVISYIEIEQPRPFCNQQVRKPSDALLVS